MEALHVTLNLQEECEDLQRNLSSIQAELENLVDEAETLNPEDEDDAERMAQIEFEVDTLDDLESRYESYIQMLETAMEEWGGCEVEMKELTAQETKMLKDEIQRRKDRQGWDSYPDGMHEVEFLKKAVVSTPPNAPNPDEIHAIPNRMFEWLKQRANNLNSVGDFDMGNSSLQERMAARTSSTSS